jgi:hypothetical protein
VGIGQFGAAVPWGCFEESAGVVVLWIGEDPFGCSTFYDFSGLHDGHLIAEIADDVQVVGDEQICEPFLLLQVLEQVQNLGLDGNIKGAGGFVQDQETGRGGQRASDADALALSSGELMREPMGVLSSQPALVQQIVSICLEGVPFQGSVGPKGLCH